MGRFEFDRLGAGAFCLPVIAHSCQLSATLAELPEQGLLVVGCEAAVDPMGLLAKRARFLRPTGLVEQQTSREQAANHLPLQFGRLWKGGGELLEAGVGFGIGPFGLVEMPVLPERI